MAGKMSAAVRSRILEALRLPTLPLPLPHGLTSRRASTSTPWPPAGSGWLVHPPPLRRQNAKGLPSREASSLALVDDNALSPTPAHPTYHPSATTDESVTPERWGMPPFKRWRRFVGSRQKFTPQDAEHLQALQPRLLRQVAEVVSSVVVLPRKELFEAWEVAVRVHSAFPRAAAVADLAAGHGLLGWILLLLAHEQGTPRTVECVDVCKPRAAQRLEEEFLQRFPALVGKFLYRVGRVQELTPISSTVLTSVHACGPLTDHIIVLAIAARCPVILMPCCHSIKPSKGVLLPLTCLENGALAIEREELKEAKARFGVSVAVDGVRADVLRGQGFTVLNDQIPRIITPSNQIILATPIERAVTEAHPWRI
ncbi:hypothetical protein AB1Y20_017385 [Prymnesium parvum]|uniref:Methyltransferase domain-containing protein n=1 Tax=Prymnesium parvum TaxID=97485 RepID=A0AB34JLK6_PRYPA